MGVNHLGANDPGCEQSVERMVWGQMVQEQMVKGQMVQEQMV